MQRSIFLLVLWVSTGLLLAQKPDPDVPMVTFKVQVVAKTAKAINYRHRSGATKINFAGTAILPKARGEAKVESKQGYIEIEVEFDNLAPATMHGPEYLTYVMWAITPEGRATNLGEVLLNGTKSKLNVTTENQAFGLIVTAEPYFSVTQPSDVVVLENMVRPDTVGKVDVIDAKYDLLQRGNYSALVTEKMVVDPRVPIELYEARQAVQIARATGAAKYAADTFKKATDLLAQSEGYLARKAGMKPVAMISREAVQTAEDARVITVKRREEEALMNERAAAAEREAKAQAEAVAEGERAKKEAENARLETDRRKQAETDRAMAEKAKAEAEAATAEARKLKAEAEVARAEAEKARAEAEKARAEAEVAKQAALVAQQAALADLERAKAAVAEAEKGRLRAEDEKTALRKQLLDQFNLILETRDSARGLIVNLSDVLFDFGKFTLRPPTREKLAKISGIILAHPGLKLEVEGHTDDVGSDEFNQKLSEQRSDAVRTYLMEQGLNGDLITSVGFGKTVPSVPNTNAANRQKNRRVEMVVSGEVIGTKLMSKPAN
ncbi:MAG: OmpA family protein [Acidobacteria bacterium]|nr:OmpA family protein [Acidobacteriota bacterium]